MKLLDINDLAVLMQCSVSHARQNVVTHQAFPKPILLPGGTKRPLKRWDEDEVVSFLRGLKPVKKKSAKSSSV